MMLRLLALALASVLPLLRAQTCDSSIAETIIEDLTSLNPIYTAGTTLYSSAAIASSGTTLTTTAAASHGALFFAAPNDFQGTGGFSLKFVLQATAGGTGDAWEAIVADSSALGSAAPPYRIGEPSNGVAGWSRLNAFVVEFDTRDSGSTENDVDASHVAVYISGAEVCKTSLAVNLASGDKYTVWLDYDGFATQANVRISSANSATRPTTATLECSVDLWATLSIASSNHVGFAAYNPTGETGAEHALVDGISIADGYKPYDTNDCSSYAKCSAKTASSLCVTSRGDGTCDVFTCNSGWVWDVAGSECCAFVERTSWSVSSSVTSYAAGDVVACEQTRRVIGYLTTSDRCA